MGRQKINVPYFDEMEDRIARKILMYFHNFKDTNHAKTLAKQRDSEGMRVYQCIKEYEKGELKPHRALRLLMDLELIDDIDLKDIGGM